MLVMSVFVLLALLLCCRRGRREFVCQTPELTVCNLGVFIADAQRGGWFIGGGDARLQFGCGVGLRLEVVRCLCTWFCGDLKRLRLT